MFENNELNNLDVIVYCGGKCGSSTLNNTFLKNGLNSFKTHDNNYFKYLCNKFNKDKNKSIFDVINFNKKQKKTLYIIDSYRNPIERRISSFFQNIHTHIPDYTNQSIYDIIQIFNENFLHNLEKYKSIDEVLLYYDLPSFTIFDFTNKYNIIKKDNILFIKIRFLDIACWDKILSNILNKKISIYNDNLSNTKNIYDMYKKFKEIYTLPKESFDNVIKSDNDFKIYNTEEEQMDYINYWKQKTY